MMTKQKVPTWFWVVSVIALVWNIMGVLAYLGHAFMTPEMIEALPEAERELIESTPAWVTAAFAIAVWGGTLACLLLLLRKKLAHLVFIISFIGIICQLIYNFFIANSMEVYGPGAAIMPIMVVGIGIYLIMFSKKAIKNSWIS